MNEKKVLIVTYYWPPSGGVGVQRWMNYAIQLKRLGWEPIIYTPENPQFELKDASLLEKVKDIRVVKTKIWEPFNFFHRLTGNRNKKSVTQGTVLEKESSSFKDKLFIRIRGNFFIPDPRKFWVKPSVKFLTNLIHEEGIETIITTGPPHSMHLIGRGVKKRTGVRWLADFRDPWSKWDVLKKLKTSPFGMSQHRRLEKSVLTKGDGVIAATESLKIQFERLGAKNAHVLYNGVSIKQMEPKKPDGKLVIGHFGMLNELRNPAELWELLDEMSESMDVELRLGGIVSESIKKQIESLPNLSSRTTFLSYLTHDEVLNEYEKCDVLLLLQNRTDNANHLVPLKFFELLATSRWVLALGPEGNEIDKFSNELSSFLRASYDESEKIEAFIKGAKESRPDLDYVTKMLSRFSYENQADVLESIIQKTRIE